MIASRPSVPCLLLALLLPLGGGCRPEEGLVTQPKSGTAPEVDAPRTDSVPARGPTVPAAPDVVRDSLVFRYGDTTEVAGIRLRTFPGIPGMSLRATPRPAAKAACGCDYHIALNGLESTDFAFLAEDFHAVDSLSPEVEFRTGAFNLQVIRCLCRPAPGPLTVQGGTLLARQAGRLIKIRLDPWSGPATGDWGYRAEWAYDRGGSGRFPTRASPAE